jgi:ABC-type lipoprotein release transport system permease subunit
MHARAGMAARKRGLIVLALLTGAFGAVVLSSAAGARRTDSSFRRFLDDTSAAQIEVGNALDPPVLAAVQAMPEVERAAPYTFFIMTPERVLGKPDTIEGISFAVPVDGRWFHTVDRPRVVEGRAPNPAAPEEAAVNEPMARQYHLHPGSTLPFRAYTPEQLFTVVFGGANEPPAGPLVTVKVVGIVRLAADLSVFAGNDRTALGTPAMYRKYADSVANFGINLVVRAHIQREIASFIRRIEKTAADATQAGHDIELFASDRKAVYDSAEQAVHVQAIALAMFAGLTALTALLVLGQALSRRIHIGAADYPVLRALGMTRKHLFLTGLIPAIATVAVGGGLAVVGAILASPLFPFAFARRAEPHLGLDVDVLALVVVGGGFVIALVGRSALASWRAATSFTKETPEPGTSAIGGAMTKTGLPASVTIGAGMALAPPRGRAAVSVRTAMVGAIAALAAMSAGLGIATSIHKLVTTPHLYGVNWDVAVNGGEDPASAEAITTDLRSQPGLGAYSTALGSDVFINGRRTQGYLFRQNRGNVFFTLLEGAQPRSSDEIALGGETMRRLDVHIGDAVTVKGERLSNDTSTPPKEARFKVVGRIVLPAIDDDTLGDGAAFDISATETLGNRIDFPIILARLRPGTDRAATVRALTEKYGPTNVRTHDRSATVINLQRVQDLPPQLADVLLLLALATVAHTVVTSVRERRRDIAILKTLGFIRRQALSVVAAQATAFMIVALTLGIPLGYALGKWSWTALANRIGFVPAPAIEAAALAIYTVGVLLAANLVATWPGRAAARTRPSIVLRAE